MGGAVGGAIGSELLKNNPYGGYVGQTAGSVLGGMFGGGKKKQKAADAAACPQ